MPALLTASDRLEIKALFANWSMNEDHGQSEAWAALFATEGRYTNGKGELVTGHDSLVHNSHERWGKPANRRNAHWMGDPVIVATEGGAQARHYAMLVEHTADGGYRLRGLTERTYDLCREDGKWRIEEPHIDRQRFSL